MTIEEILDGLNAISREACVSLSNGWRNGLDLERVVRVCSEAYNALRPSPAPPGLYERDGHIFARTPGGHDIQLTQEPNPRIAELNRAAAAVAGHPDPVPLIEKLSKPVRIVVGSVVVSETHGGIYISKSHDFPHPGHVERADIEDLHKALGQYLARKSIETAVEFIDRLIQKALASLLHQPSKETTCPRP